MGDQRRSRPQRWVAHKVGSYSVPLRWRDAGR